MVPARKAERSDRGRAALDRDERYLLRAPVSAS